MEKIKKSGILKMLSYILIPILVLTIFIGIIYLSYNSYNNEDLAKKDYYKTDQFVSYDYNSYIRKLVYMCENINKIRDSEEYYISNDNEIYLDDNYRRINGEGYILAKEKPNIYYSSSYNKCFNYILIDQNQDVYTNMQIENLQNEIKSMKNNKYVWYKEGKKITTDLEQVNENGLSYRYGIEELVDIQNNNFDMYLQFNPDKVTFASYTYMNQMVYEIILNTGKMPVILMVISIIMLLIITIYLFWSIGHSKNVEGIQFGKFEKVPYEIVLILAFIVVMLLIIIMKDTLSINNYEIYQDIVLLITYFIAYAVCAVTGITTIKRIKSGMFIKTTLIYMILKWVINLIKKWKELLVDNKTITKKLTIYYIAYVIISSILGAIILLENVLFVPIILIFWGWALYKMLKYAKQLDDIKNSLKEIYEGKENVKIDEQNMEVSLKEMAKYINSMSEGLTQAVEKSLKSERMKTELITNVSHDIKTPLTSIINYVDLLKKEEMSNEKAKEYLEILDQKSQRLKRLTEDLVEASKASSGNIKLNIEKINVKELINQISGEFEGKFKESNLELVLGIPKEETIINADSRYLYRVIENMYSNIVKYALKGSRVYVDIIKEKDKVRIELKNISKEKLNITADELMQRFVRGETSRNTEGSGLGLSIAESLTKLQGGTFQIHLDGDLFKVIIEF